jgi:HAD superfamily phosphatase (TIGR01681 family)
VLSSFNLDLLPPLLAEALERAGVDAEVQASPFGQIGQQALDPSSELYASAPQAVVIVPAVEDMLAPVFAGTVAPEDPEAERLLDARLEELESSLDTILERLPGSMAYIVVMGTDRAPVSHVLDPRSGQRGQAIVERFVERIRALGELSPRIAAVDWEWHRRSAGSDALSDDRLWYLGRMRFNPAGTAVFADVCARYVAASRGMSRKVVAVDLDDTLWGGIVGEVGIEGLQIGEDGLGLAFQDFQRELLKLRATGVLLVACSKNNRADAIEVFERHAGMVLRLEHFAAERINWQDKATNVRELAAELDLGVDSFVFLDDNPAERRWVAEAVPGVAVPELPPDPVDRPRFLRELALFDRLRLTDADSQRAAAYAAQRERRRLASTTVSM